MMPGFSPDGTEELEIDGVKATFQILNGDHGEKGRGETVRKNITPCALTGTMGTPQWALQDQSGDVHRHRLL